MNIQNNLFDYINIYVNGELSSTKDYKWYDRSAIKTFMQMGALLDKNNKLPRDLLFKLRSINLFLYTYSLSKTGPLVKAKRLAILRDLNDVSDMIKTNDNYLLDSEFIKDYKNYLVCLNQYISLSSMEWLVKELDTLIAFSKKDNLSNLVNNEQYQEIINYNEKIETLLAQEKIDDDLLNSLVEAKLESSGDDKIDAKIVNLKNEVEAYKKVIENIKRNGTRR